MSITQKIGSVAAIIVGAFVLSALFMFTQPDSLSGQSNLGTARACQSSTVTKVSVGNQGSTQVLATSSLRAWARIQQVDNATNTVNVVKGNGVAASTALGMQFHKASATATVQWIEFGLATNDPYVGAVTAITDVGSTTLLVSECTYRN